MNKKNIQHYYSNRVLRKIRNEKTNRCLINQLVASDGEITGKAMYREDKHYNTKNKI